MLPSGLHVTRFTDAADSLAKEAFYMIQKQSKLMVGPVAHE